MEVLLVQEDGSEILFIFLIVWIITLVQGIPNTALFVTFLAPGRWDLKSQCHPCEDC